MRNYDFNYLVEKVTLLNEMGRSSTNRPETDPNVIKFINEYGAKVRAALFEGWKPPAPMMAYREFITSTLYEDKEGISFQYKSISDYAKELIQKSNKMKKDYLSFIMTGSDDSNKRGAWVMSIWMNKESDYLVSEEFLNKITDPEYIANWRVSYNDRKKDASANKAYNKRVKRKYGVGPDDYEALKGEVWPIIVKINRKGRSLMPKGVLGSLRRKEQIISGDDMPQVESNADMYELESFVEALIGVVDDPYTMEEFNMNSKDLQNILGVLQQRVDNKQPLTKEKIISNIINKFPDEGFRDYVSGEYEEFLESGRVETDVEKVVKPKERVIQDVLDIYTPQFLDNVEAKGIINPQEKETLMKWKELFEFGKQDEIQDGGMTNDDWKETVTAVRQHEADKRGDQPKKTRGRPRKIRPEDEQVTEGVMSYFSEQVVKDKFSDKRGVFVERGFKKPVNYAHWLEINR